MPYKNKDDYKKWCKKNKDKKKDYNKKYLEKNNQKVICEFCGKEVGKLNLISHQKTFECLKYQNCWVGDLLE